MKRIISAVLLTICIFGMHAQSALPPKIVLTPYVEHDANTPTADKILLDKLNRIITQHGVSSSSGIQTPFIITGHAVELNKETTATVPPHTAVDISLTLYIGNGEEGVLFSTYTMNLRGVGDGVDKAYAAAFKRLNVNDAGINAAIMEAQMRISDYYEQQGPSLINKARQLAAAGDFGEAFAVLLRIPAVCPQYNEAQDLLLQLVRDEADVRNREVIARARAAWSANPTEAGAANARDILAEVSNPSPAICSEINGLTSEMSGRLESVADSQRAMAAARDANAHKEEMARIEAERKAAVARAQNQPNYVYHIHWW